MYPAVPSNTPAVVAATLMVGEVAMSPSALSPASAFANPKSRILA
jgi:hypothetical protein